MTKDTTDTNQASELYELCKKVYKLTKLGSKYPDWIKLDGMKLVYVRSNGKHETVDWSSDLVMGEKWGDWLVPLYTSDYLLEKLPVYSDDGEGMLTVTTRQGVERNGWMAYYEDVDGYSVSHEGIGKSPLLALLKLTIALSEAGELK